MGESYRNAKCLYYNVIISLLVHIPIIQIVFKHFEEGVGLDANQIAHTDFFPDATIVIFPQINFFLKAPLSVIRGWHSGNGVQKQGLRT